MLFPPALLIPHSDHFILILPILQITSESSPFWNESFLCVCVCPCPTGWMDVALNTWWSVECQRCITFLIFLLSHLTQPREGSLEGYAEEDETDRGGERERQRGREGEMFHRMRISLASAQSSTFSLRAVNDHSFQLHATVMSRQFHSSRSCQIFARRSWWSFSN